jgi:hypothetical protein
VETVSVRDDDDAKRLSAFNEMRCSQKFVYEARVSGRSALRHSYFT